MSRKKSQRPALAAEPARPLDGRITLALLLLILLIAAGLRIPYLTSAPPGLNQDEAANAWNAWCLLKTGTDQVGAPWPIFYTRALGENRTTLFLYLLLPFEALGGLNVWTARLPSAVGGVLTVLLLYWIAARLFDRPTGLIAAALLALAPWHITLSRLGHEAAVGPLLTAASFAALLWAGFPLTDRESQPIPWRALLAGLCIGISCYGYPAIRLFLPVFCTGCVLMTLPSWWRMVHTRRGLFAIIALAVGVAVTFGPLVYHHIAHADIIAKRATHNWLWQPNDPLGVRIVKVIERYFGHFGPDYLWVRGDYYEMLSPNGFGALHWYTLPLILAGVVALICGVPKSRAMRILLWCILAFPTGDCVNSGTVLTRAADGTPLTMSMHALRSAPGLNAMLLLAAVGAVGIGRLLWRWRPRMLAIVSGVFILASVTLCDVRFVKYYFGPYNRRWVVFRSFHVDEIAAWQWLKPRLDNVDAVFMTGIGMNMPYIVAMVALGYDPHQWFQDTKDVRPLSEWDHYFRIGKLYFYLFMDDKNAQIVEQMRTDDRREHVVFIVHPGELRASEPTFTIPGWDGKPSLAVYDTEM